MNRIMLVAALLFAVASPIRAQEPVGPEPVTSEPAQAMLSDGRFLVRVSPIGLVFGDLKVAGEMRLTSNLALEGAVGAISDAFFIPGLDTRSAYVGARYYPGTLFRGFSVSGTAGVFNLSAEYEDCVYDDVTTWEPTCTQKSDSFVWPTVGTELAYSFRLGEQRRFYFSPAVGAMRLFISENVDEDIELDFSLPWPTARLAIGYIF